MLPTVCVDRHAASMSTKQVPAVKGNNERRHAKLLLCPHVEDSPSGEGAC